jgi:hypothetical protein
VYRVIAVVKLSIFAVVLCFVQLLGVSKQIAVVRLDAKPWAMVGTNEQSFKWKLQNFHNGRCSNSTSNNYDLAICLLNVSFKFFTKVSVRRLTVVADKLVSQSQTVFVPGHNIMEGIVILHETIYKMHRKR